MTISVKFFANLREQLGRDEEILDFREGMSVSDVWDIVTNSQEMPPSLMVAVNLEYEKKDAKLSDGDEVAFFPPVSGG